VSGATLAVGNAIALVLVGGLVAFAYHSHEKRAQLSKLSVVFIMLSVPDFVLDCFWVHDRGGEPGHRSYYVSGLLILIVTTLLNTVGAFAAIRHETKRGGFKPEDFFNRGGGVAYMFIFFLSCTNPDALLLLPWEYSAEASNSLIFQQTGFPSKYLFVTSLLRLLEDVGQSANQTLFVVSEGSDALTVLSLVTSWIGIVYLCFFKAVLWITHESPKTSEGGVELRRGSTASTMI
jgi:hypothetical protein